MRPGLRETRVTRELLKLAESSWSRSPWNSLKQAEVRSGPDIATDDY